MRATAPIRGCRLVASAAALSLALWTTACSNGDGSTSPAPGAHTPPPVPVLVATAAPADVPVELHAIGTVEAVQSTPIRAQVGGTITGVGFREGDPVKAGQVLFQIDPRPFEASLRQLEADLARLQAQAENAEAQVRSAEAQIRNAEAQAAYADSEAKRYEGLVRKDFVTRSDYDQRVASAEAAKASVDSSRAALDANRAAARAAREAIRSTRAAIENARLQLGYTTIRAPVTGQTGSLQAKQGDLVKANDTLLVVINQIEPILVRFAVPEGSLADVQKYRRQGTLQVKVVPPGGGAPREGRLVFVDNAVDPATATIVLKAEFPNQDHALWPGQFLDVGLILYTYKDALVVPSEAIERGQDGPYVFVVGRDGKASVRALEPGMAVGGRTVVEKGLTAGEAVVIDGQLRLTPGARVAIRESLGGQTDTASAGEAARAAGSSEQGKTP